MTAPPAVCITRRLVRHVPTEAAQLRQATDALDNATTYGYQYGLLKNITDANGNVTSYGYDVNRNLSSTTFPDGKVESYTRTAKGVLQSVTDRRGNRAEYG